ncbi:hypothetical protein DH2020_039491 [Rehmannia glutinosa]|uniref:Pre-mRNA cleavage factor Im 25 kDa subunit n=1 Tax=Rehmannia glutinosa TaxID=99300 RepID=A0ABR0UWX8_REHGL
MDDPSAVFENGNSHQSDESNVLDIYPLSCYYFGSRGSASFKNETISDRVLRMKANYDAYGMRNCVAAVIVVELFKHPHLLLLQVQNSIYKLPDIECLKRKLSSKLSAGEDGRGPEWEECTKLFLVKLPASRRFIVPKNFRLLAIPLCQLHENEETYGPIISGVPSCCPNSPSTL